MEIAHIADWGLDRGRNGLGIGRQRWGWIGDGDVDRVSAYPVSYTHLTLPTNREV